MDRCAMCLKCWLTYLISGLIGDSENTALLLNSHCNALLELPFYDCSQEEGAHQGLQAQQLCSENKYC